MKVDAAFSQSSPILSEGRPHMIMVPGILARCDQQVEVFGPVAKRLDLQLSTLDYQGDYFNAEAAAWQVAQMLIHACDIKQPTILFGSSLGGMLCAKALGIARKHVSLETLSNTVFSIIVDSPASRGDLVMVPGGRMGWVNTPLSMAFTGRPSTDANDGWGKSFLNTFRKPPKKDETETWEGGPSYDDIKAKAIEGLTGHPFTRWYDQVAWMLNGTFTPEWVDGLEVTYVACTKGNVTVRQPNARKAWEPHVTRVVEVETPHCAYLQAQQTWSAALQEILLEKLSVTEVNGRVI